MDSNFLLKHQVLPKFLWKQLHFTNHHVIWSCSVISWYIRSTSASYYEYGLVMFDLLKCITFECKYKNVVDYSKQKQIKETIAYSGAAHSSAGEEYSNKSGLSVETNEQKKLEKLTHSNVLPATWCENCRYRVKRMTFWILFARRFCKNLEIIVLLKYK